MNLLNTAFAAAPPCTGDFCGLVDLIISSILTPFIGLLAGLSLAFFLWGVVKYIRESGDEKAREEGKKMMFYGLIGLFVFVSVWGLVNVVVNTFGLDSNTIPTPRQFN